jgi:hypothetical protein
LLSSIAKIASYAQRKQSDVQQCAQPKDGVLSALPYIGLDPDSCSPTILTESRSLAGVLRDIVAEYRARIASTNGQCGGFLRTNIAPRLRPGDCVFYLGDLDLSGDLIEANTRRVLEREIGGALMWERLALTEAQVREYALPVIVKRDRRYKDGRPHRARDRGNQSARADRYSAGPTRRAAPRAACARS